MSWNGANNPLMGNAQRIIKKKIIQGKRQSGGQRRWTGSQKEGYMTWASLLGEGGWAERSAGCFLCFFKQAGFDLASGYRVFISKIKWLSFWSK